MKPIIFNTENVKAILDGRKTQTRRVIKPQPKPCCHKEIFTEKEKGYNSPPDWHGQRIDWIGYKYEGREGWFCYVCGNGLRHIDEWSAHGIICPYGQVGDRLWVRRNKQGKFIWKKVEAEIWLEITDIRVERLNQITEQAIWAEGISPFPFGNTGRYVSNCNYTIGKQNFIEVWDSINAKYKWEVNPWVWVISFTPTE